MVTKAELKKLFPRARAVLLDAVVNNWSAAEAVGITTPARIRQFLANIGVETGGLTSVEESLNYSVDALLKKFGRHRISEADAKKYGRIGKTRKADEVAIANTIYGGAFGRANLGNTQPGDGWKYRGGGGMQTTGRANYEAVGFLENPEALREPVTAFLTAVKEWDKRGCNALADAGKTTELRKRINGGTNGLEDVEALLVKAKSIWPDGARASAPKAAPVIDLYDGKEHDELKAIQTTLDEIGYPEVGSIDGKWGTRSAAAVMAFRLDNGLQTTDPRVDPEFLTKLALKPQRPVSHARATATLADLRQEDDKAVKQTDQTNLVGKITTGGGFFFGGKKLLDEFAGSSDTVKQVIDTLNPVQAFITENFWLILVGVGGFIVWKSGILNRIRLQKHQTGQDVSA